ncbi:MAG: tRNA lysidine(34) synthetase TilS [Ferruginibacter sp.]
MTLQQQFLAYIKKHHLFTKEDHLLIAVSGGLDSAVLCALCKDAGFRFSIAHCNFKLREEESEGDEMFVKNMAVEMNVPLFVTSFDTGAEAEKNKTSIEETARNLRYNWFLDVMALSKNTDSPLSLLLTAHHADDNIETVVMNFFRGTGIKGLRGIQPKQNKIVRPLLFARRKELQEYAVASHVAFVTDSTNATNDYTRNLFRNEILGSIEKVYPEALKNILKNINRFADVEYLYNERMEQIIEKLVERKGAELHVPVLKLLKTKPLHTVIYEIIKDAGFTAAQVQDAEKLLYSESGKYIKSTTHIILRNRNWLIISPLSSVEASLNIVLEEEDNNIVFAAGTLSLKKTGMPQNLITDVDSVYINAAELHYPLLLRKWKTGDYFYPLGMNKKKKLNRFFIDQKLSLLQKEQVWVLESNKKIVWVIGHRIDDRFKVTSSSTKIVKLNLTR